MPLSSKHRTPNKVTWPDVLQRKGRNKKVAERLFNFNNNNKTNDTTSLFNTVEELQESSALVMAGPSKSVRTLHHCFNDLQRERVVGVFGLQNYAPFKEAVAETIAQPIQPPTTRESINAGIPTFQDFIQLEGIDSFPTMTTTGDQNLADIEARRVSLWVSGEHLNRYYGKANRATTIIEKILDDFPSEMDDATARNLEAEFYDQLVFLWAVEKGYLPTVTLKDPADLEETQERIEEVNSILEKGGVAPEADPKEGDPKGPKTNPPENGSEDDDSYHSVRDPKPKHKKRKRKKKNQRRRGSESSSTTSQPSASSGSDSDANNRRRGYRDDRQNRSRGRGRDRGSQGPSRSPSRRRSASSIRRRRRSRSNSQDNNHRSRSRDGHRRARSPARGHSQGRTDEDRRNNQLNRDDPLFTAFVQGVTALTQSQLDSVAREKRKTSVLNRLSRRQVFLFDALSARDWDDEHPQRTAEADMILEDRDVERNWNLLVDMTSKWPGQISKPAFIQFLTKGFVSQDRPGGFTVFMFQPPRKHTQGKKDRKRNLRNVLGKNGDVDDDDLEFYAKNDFYIPKSVYEGELQIQMAVKLLDLFTNYRSIASDGYRFGMAFLDERRNIFHAEQENDELFMARYLTLLDSMFQLFAEKLAAFHQHRDPIYHARRRLRGKMARDIERIMQDIDYDIVPHLPLPPRLLTEQPKPTQGNTKKPKSSNKDKDDDEPTATPGWWTKNPSIHGGWALPTGKSFKDFFNTNESKGRVNLARLPRAKHHNPTVRLKRNLCARYQVEGECSKNCNLAHIPSNKLDSELKKDASEAFKAAYQS